VANIPDQKRYPSPYPRTRLIRHRRPRSAPSAASLDWVQGRSNPSTPPEPVTVDRPEFYTRESAARRLGVGKTTVWELTTRGVIGVAYIGRKPLIPAVELDRYIAALIEEARERSMNSVRARKLKT
jgi:excisionase family DNA binding protein